MDSFLGITNIASYIWLIPFMFSLHEFEEWNILKWYKRYYKNLPGSTNTSIRIHIIVFALLSFLLTFLAGIAGGTLFFSLIVVFMSSFILLNFLQHVIWTVQLKAYSLGLATASLCMLAVVYVNRQLVGHGLIFLPFYFMALLIVPTIVETIRTEGEMTREIRNVHLVFIKIAKVFGG